VTRSPKFVDGQSTRPSPPSLRRRGRGTTANRRGVSLGRLPEGRQDRQDYQDRQGRRRLGGRGSRLVESIFGAGRTRLRSALQSSPMGPVCRRSARLLRKDPSLSSESAKPKFDRLVRRDEALIGRALILAVLAILAILATFLQAVSLPRIAVGSLAPSATVRAVGCVAGARAPTLPSGQSFIMSDLSRDRAGVNGRC